MWISFIVGRNLLLIGKQNLSGKLSTVINCCGWQSHHQGRVEVLDSVEMVYLSVCVCANDEEDGLQTDDFFDFCKIEIQNTQTNNKQIDVELPPGTEWSRVLSLSLIYAYVGITRGAVLSLSIVFTDVRILQSPVVRLDQIVEMKQSPFESLRKEICFIWATLFAWPIYC